MYSQLVWGVLWRCFLNQLITVGFKLLGQTHVLRLVSVTIYGVSFSFYSDQTATFNNHQ